MSTLTKETKIRLVGTRPLLMARGEAANPFDWSSKPIKTISQKRKKTEDDYNQLARLQFESSLYFDEEIGPFIPVDNLLKCMELGAAKYKESGVVKSQVSITGLVGKELDPGAAALIYDGPRDIQGLYDAGFAFLKMGKIPSSKVSILTSRARFKVWAVEFIVETLDLEPDRVMDYWNMAGKVVGLCAWRPRNGLFSVTRIK
jgi:hypothetical protein